MSKTSQKKSSQTDVQRADKIASPSLTVYWHRVYEKTKADIRRLREYGLPPDTPVFRIVQCNREKATLYGDVDRLDRSSQLTTLVRDIIEGRPPEGYSPTLPILTEPNPIYLRTRGRLKKIEKKTYKGRMADEEFGDKMTVFNADAILNDNVLEVLADILVDYAMRQKKDEAEPHTGND